MLLLFVFVLIVCVMSTVCVMLLRYSVKFKASKQQWQNVLDFKVELIFGSPHAGVEMLPIYLSISGNFRKWQVKNIDTFPWWQANKSSVIQILSIWINILCVFHLQSCSIFAVCMTKAANVTSLNFPRFFADQTWMNALFQFAIWIVC